MDNSWLFVVFFLAISCIGCTVAGTIIYIKGIKKGILICEAIRNESSDPSEIFTTYKEPAEFGLIEKDRKEEDQNEGQRVQQD